MNYYDVFNGDADGIFALVQLRRAMPRKTQMVTGVKRTINLLADVHPEQGDHINVLDVSMRDNMLDVQRILDVGATIYYADHHSSGDIPDHPNLRANIQPQPNVCTALIINEELEGKYKLWAISAAFGDNMVERAYELVRPLGLSAAKVETLKTFGQMVNYNAYGHSVPDLHYAPADLAAAMTAYDTPFDYLDDHGDVLETLRAGFEDDMAKARATKQIQPYIYLLDDAPWARRIYGTFINELLRENPGKPHAVITHNAIGSYMVSIRAPLTDENPKAFALAKKFKSGGGRVQAAGVNELHKSKLDIFTFAFERIFSDFL